MDFGGMGGGGFGGGPRRPKMGGQWGIGGGGMAQPGGPGGMPGTQGVTMPGDDTSMVGGGTRQPPINPPSTGGLQPYPVDPGFGEIYAPSPTPPPGTPGANPPSTYNPSQPISTTPGGNGWGSQTNNQPGHGHQWAGIPGEGGQARVARMNAEVEAAMAQRHAEGLAKRQAAQARRQANLGGEDGMMPESMMDRHFYNNEAYQKMNGTYQPKAPTLPYGIPTGGPEFNAFLQSGNFTPQQVNTLGQMASQMESALSNAQAQGLFSPEQEAQAQAKIEMIRNAINGKSGTSTNLMFQAPNTWQGSGV